MGHIVIINLLILVIAFVGGLCQDLEEKSYEDDATSEVVKVLL